MLALEAPEELAHLDDLHRIEAADRLVEDQEPRPVHDRLRDAHALLEAVRERGDELVRATSDSGSTRAPRGTRLSASAFERPRSRAAKCRYSRTVISP